MKKFLILSSLTTLSIFADMPQKPADIAIQTSQQDPNPSARFGMKDKSGVFLTGEALWFKPIQKIVKGAKYSLLSDQSNFDTNVSYFNHKFAPGYRVALGYNTPYDGWDLILSYTGFNYKHNNPYTSDKGQVALQVDSPIWDRTGNLKATYYYNLGDLDMGRMFKVSQHLNLRPHAGVRSLWLTQKLHYSFDTNPKYIIQKQSGTLVGLFGGVDGLWKFAKEFSIYANFAVACLVNNQKFSRRTTVEDAINNQLYIATKQNTKYGTNVVTNIDAFIGLRWDRSFSNDDYHFGINLGYELHDYINVNQQVVSPFSGINTTYESGQDFAIQGVALGARFDF